MNLKHRCLIGLDDRKCIGQENVVSRYAQNERHSLRFAVASDAPSKDNVGVNINPVPLLLLPTVAVL